MATRYFKYGALALLVVSVLLLISRRPREPDLPAKGDSDYVDFDEESAYSSSFRTAVWSPTRFNETKGPKKKILITGGAGFVGSHLTDRLLQEGHTVIVLDNFFTGSPRNVAHWQKHPRFKLIKHDVIDPFYISGLDQIYHLASPASPKQYQKDPIFTTKTNVWGTLNMLELAVKNNARVLLASTSEIYGDPLVHPQVETNWGNVNPIGPRACYDEAKRMAETMMFDYHRTRGTDIRIVRIFNTYGPRMSAEDGRVVSNFIVQSLSGESLTVFGSGKQTRSFCYISDLVDGIVRLMNAEGVTGPINIGNPVENTVYELASKITEMVGGELKVDTRPLPTNDPQKRRPNITLARTVLGWEPKVPLERGLRDTIAYFRKVLQQR